MEEWYTKKHYHAFQNFIKQNEYALLFYCKIQTE